MAKTKAEIQRDYEKRSGYAALKRYKAKVLAVEVTLNREKDTDIIDQLDQEQPLSPQLKALIRKGIRSS